MIKAILTTASPWLLLTCVVDKIREHLAQPRTEIRLYAETELRRLSAKQPQADHDGVLQAFKH